MAYIKFKNWILPLLVGWMVGCGRPAPVKPPTPRQPDRLWAFNLEPGTLAQANEAIRSGQVLVLKKEAQDIRVLLDCSFPGGLQPWLNPWSETHLISTRTQVEASFLGNAPLMEKASARVEQGEGLMLRLVSVASYSSGVAGAKQVNWGSLQPRKRNGCDGATHLAGILHLGAAQLTTARQQGGAISVGPVALGTSGSEVFDERIGDPDLCQGGSSQDPRCQSFIAMDLIAIAAQPSSKVDRQACDEREQEICLRRCNAGSGGACNNVGYFLETQGADALPKEQRLSFARGYYQRACQLRSQKGCANEVRLQLALSPDSSSKQYARGKLEMYCEQGIDFACEVAGSEQIKQGEKVAALGSKPGIAMDPVGAISLVTGAASSAQRGIQLLQRACSLGNGEACYKLQQHASQPVPRP
jgi:hypothetical protein